jgi:DNA-directed RNA polymerase specialized sigma24 family protein
MTPMKLEIRHLLAGLSESLRKFRNPVWGRRATRATGRELARDLRLPPDVVSRVLDEAASGLRNLADKGDAADARPVIDKAVDELAQLGFHSEPFDTAAMDQCLKELAEPDLVILRHSKEGMKHAEIAALMGTDVESVRRSLVRTYADLRIAMMGWGDGDDSDPLAPAAAARNAPHAALHQRLRLRVRRLLAREQCSRKAQIRERAKIRIQALTCCSSALSIAPGLRHYFPRDRSLAGRRAPASHAAGDQPLQSVPVSSQMRASS